MRIGELAQHTQCSTSRIRFYEKRGLLPPAPRQHNGYRQYPQESVQLIKAIQMAQSLGFTLAEIKQAFASQAEPLLSGEQLMDQLNKKMNSVDEQLKELSQLKKRIKSLMNFYDGIRHRDHCADIDELTQVAMGERHVLNLP